MKRHLLILSLLLLTATSASAQTAYAIWCADAKTLYFDYTTSSITAGSTYQGQTVTNVWSGEDVLNTKFFYYGGKWGVTYCVWYEAAHSTAERAVIQDAFKGAPVKKTNGWFCEFQNLTAVEGLGNISGDNLEETQRMFYECRSLTTLDLSGFQTPNVTDMSYMFATCSALTSLDLSGFDTSNVWNMSYMFSSCSSLRELDVSNFDTSNVTSMYYMFSTCNSLKELDLSNFNTSKVKDMGGMFISCSSLTKVNLSSFDTSKVTNLTYMFYSCSSLTWLDLYNFNTEQVTNFSYMFQKCTSLKRLDITNFTTPNSKSFADMFSQCGRLQTIYCDSTWTSANGSLNEGMFLGCDYLYGARGYLGIYTSLEYANPNTGYFTRNKLYPLWIAGKQVRESNKDNLLLSFEGIKAVTNYPQAYFDPSSNKVYLENVRVDGGKEPAIRSELGGLMLLVMGQEDVYLTSTDAPALQLDGNTTIGGRAFLHVEGGSAGIMTTADLRVEGQRMSVSGEYGIEGAAVKRKIYSDYFSVYDADLSVVGESYIEVNSVYACVSGFQKIKLAENVKVVYPFNAEAREFELLEEPRYETLFRVDICVPDPNYTGEDPNDYYDPSPGWNVVSGTVVISYVDPELRGDVNQDKKVDISDIVAVINQIAGTSVYPYADVNGDKKVDISDIVAIINIIASSGGGGSQTETDAAVEAGLCPDTKHPHAIDLGIGVKFACCNVGASAPWENGEYYAWGETEEKNTYNWSTYKYCDGSESTCHNLGDDIAGTQYDVAHVKWGKGWKIPSNEQFGLLINCSSEWTSVNGVDGRKVTGANGASIFLPAAGCRWSDYTDYVGSYGFYWSSTQHPNYSNDAYDLNFRSGYMDMNNHYRNLGQSVRPVK